MSHIVHIDSFLSPITEADQNEAERQFGLEQEERFRRSPIVDTTTQTESKLQRALGGDE